MQCVRVLVDVVAADSSAADTAVAARSLATVSQLVPLALLELLEPAQFERFVSRMTRCPATPDGRAHFLACLPALAAVLRVARVADPGSASADARRVAVVRVLARVISECFVSAEAPLECVGDAAAVAAECNVPFAGHVLARVCEMCVRRLAEDGAAESARDVLDLLRTTWCVPARACCLSRLHPLT
jgi:hypothetical protein